MAAPTLHIMTLLRSPTAITSSGQNVASSSTAVSGQANGDHSTNNFQFAGLGLCCGRAWERGKSKIVLCNLESAWNILPCILYITNSEIRHPVDFRMWSI